MGQVRGICISEKKGVAKHQIRTAQLIENYGIEGDAHAGNWHRQISLLGYEVREEFNRKGGQVVTGDFGENLLVEGIDFSALDVGTRLGIGSVQLEITQLGKECHSHCAIYHRVGDCIMPREGVFGRVLVGGTIQVGDPIEVLKYGGDVLRAAVITLSDKGYRQERKDLSGPLITQYLQDKGYQVVDHLLLPDEVEPLKKELINLADRRQVNLIFTTGGTGFSARDITPEATLAVATKNAPGISEAIRQNAMTITKRAMLSRAVSVIRNQTVIINLPGSPKAVQESLAFLGDTIDHGLEILTGKTGECAR